MHVIPAPMLHATALPTQDITDSLLRDLTSTSFIETVHIIVLLYVLDH